MASHFGDRLCDAVESKKTSLIVGLDPVYSRLPKSIRNHPDMNDENDVGAAVDAIFAFCNSVLKIVGPEVPAVKLNIAYFEKYLWEGLETYYSLISEAEALGIEIIGDVKRGDIGHSAGNYAEAHLKNSELVLVALSLSSMNSMAWASSIGCSSFLRIHIFCSWTCSIISSSRRVPERLMSMAG